MASKRKDNDSKIDNDSKVTCVDLSDVYCDCGRNHYLALAVCSYCDGKTGCSFHLVQCLPLGPFKICCGDCKDGLNEEDMLSSHWAVHHVSSIKHYNVHECSCCGNDINQQFYWCNVDENGEIRYFHDVSHVTKKRTPKGIVHGCGLSIQP